MMFVSVLTNAIAWLTDTLLGPAALAVTVIAVAVFGLLMMSGRLDWRRGARIILGCFIIFGAPTLASGILSASQLGHDVPGHSSPQTTAAPVVQPPASNTLSGPKTICWTCRAD